MFKQIIFNGCLSVSLMGFVQVTAMQSGKQLAELPLLHIKTPKEIADKRLEEVIVLQAVPFNVVIDNVSTLKSPSIHSDYLVALQFIQCLNLEGVEIKALNLQALDFSGCKNFKKIIIEGCNIIQSISCKGCKALTVGAVVAMIEQCPKIKEIELNETTLNTDAIKYLRTRYRTVNILFEFAVDQVNRAAIVEDL